MSYVPVYTTVEKVSSTVQVDIDTTSVPRIDEVLVYIQESEAKIIDRALGSHNASNAYIDILSTSDGRTIDPSLIADILHSPSDSLVVPLENIKHPIISITSLYKNDTELGDAPVWEALHQFTDNAASDFMLLKTGVREHGYALFIYDDLPEVQGTSRLKMTYAYGYNVPTAILSDYCTLDVAIRILTTRMGTNEIDGLSRVYGNNIGNAVVTNYTERIAEMKEQKVLIEIMHFPPPTSASAASVAII